MLDPRLTFLCKVDLYLGCFFYLAMLSAAVFPAAQYAEMSFWGRLQMFLTHELSVGITVGLAVCLGVVIVDKVQRSRS